MNEYVYRVNMCAMMTKEILLYVSGETGDSNEKKKKEKESKKKKRNVMTMKRERIKTGHNARVSDLGQFRDLEFFPSPLDRFFIVIQIICKSRFFFFDFLWIPYLVSRPAMRNLPYLLEG